MRAKNITRVHKICNQFNFGLLSINEIGGDQTNKNLQIIDICGIVSHYKISSWWHVNNYMYNLHPSSSITNVVAEIELTQVITRDNVIRGIILKVIVQCVDIVQATCCMCNKLDIWRVQDIENILEGNFDKILIQVPDLIQDFRVRVGKLGSCNARHCVAFYVFNLCSCRVDFGSASNWLEWKEFKTLTSRNKGLRGGR